jgi:hypothetical protein
VGISTAEFNSLFKTNTELCWICPSFKAKPHTSASTTTSHPGSVDSKLDSILGLLGHMNSRISNLETYNTTRDKEIDSKIDQKVHVAVRAELDHKVHDIVREELDRERRKLNLIIHGLEESEETDLKTQIQSVMNTIQIESQPAN